ncbi:hypothetical protein LTR36_001046 [Oleoguttula mirabilis]|uniref:C2H2-type domain-containing protein n=1 Tax=Oleoguttula mirabilis TaxID=1507867 RepID=A0AAV9JPY2_9PEZI|nr:hypothetical protein LTR36_001046 [Oleoguttula mirabilis]
MGSNVSTFHPLLETSSIHPPECDEYSDLCNGALLEPFETRTEDSAESFGFGLNFALDFDFSWPRTEQRMSPTSGDLARKPPATPGGAVLQSDTSVPSHAEFPPPLTFAGYDDTFGVGYWAMDSSASDTSVSGDSVRSDDDHRYKCTECKVPFANSYKLEQHAKAAGHKAYACEDARCRKSYYSRSSYVRHVASHKGPGPHVCKVCARYNQHKTFKRKDHLVQHERNCHPTEVSRVPSNQVAGIKRSSSTAIHQDFNVPMAPVSQAAIEERLNTNVNKAPKTVAFLPCPVDADQFGCQWQDGQVSKHQHARAIEIAQSIRSEFGDGHGDVLRQIEKHLHLHDRPRTLGSQAASVTGASKAQINGCIEPYLLSSCPLASPPHVLEPGAQERALEDLPASESLNCPGSVVVGDRCI